VSGLYKIHNYKKNKRDNRIDHIILTQAKNLYQKGTYLQPDNMLGSYHYTWGDWQSYFYEELKLKRLPMHYYTELVDQDYVIYKGLNKYTRSKFLQDLVKHHVIPYKYLDSLLVVIGEDYTVDPMDKRMYNHLSDKLFSEIMYYNDINYNQIIYLDDILTRDWKQMLKNSPLEYQIEPAKFFDPHYMYIQMKDYKKH